jgi:hypothetical protein
MNCQIPTAWAGEYALESKPLSMSARKSRSSGMSRARSSARIMGPYVPIRWSHSRMSS